MRAALLIASKDLKARIRDRSAILLAVVVPLVLAFIFSIIFNGISGDSTVIKVGVVDQDGGPMAQAFVQQVLEPTAKSGLISVRTETTVDSARSHVTSGSTDAAIIIPAGFSTAVQSSAPSSMAVIGNVDAPIASVVARSIADAYVADINRVRLSVATVAHSSAGGGLSPAQTAQVAARAAAARAPIAVQDASGKTKELDWKSFYAAGMAVFFLFFSVQFGVISLLEERNEGTLARLLAAPISRTSIVVGKLITSFVVGVVSMAVLAVASTVLFGASWGNPLGVGVLIVAAVLAATGVAALVASIARSAEQASNTQTIIAVALGLLGGTFFPVSQAPGFLSQITFITPQAWFLRGLGDLRGGDLSVIWLPTLAMLAFAVVTGAVAATRLQRALEL